MSDNQHEEIHTYEYSGIRERKGKVPVWLIVVYVVLSIWAIYYLWTYWYHA
jgi:multidrug resistance efflux pump